jgi:dihydroorotate dehydrogenase
LSHALAKFGIRVVTSLGFRVKQSNDYKDLTLFDCQFNNSLGLAAGLDKNGDYIDDFAALGFGFLEIGTVTPKPQYGNKKPRLFRDKPSKAIINRMGFNNKGVDHLVKKLKKRKSDIPIGVSIGKNADTPNHLAQADYLYCLERVFEYADYIAINISSPNTKDLREFEIKKELTNLIKPIKERQLQLARVYKYKPLLLKISPDNNEKSIEDICETLLRFSIDGLICTNTTVNHDHVSGSGGLSGKPLMTSSTEILKIAKKLLGDEFPIIASGGVMSKEDYQKKIDEGADLVQIYTGFIYEGPKLIDDILNK